MSDELKVCLAALFLNKGKDVFTAKEFVMYVSLDLRWMQVRDANLLMESFVATGLLSKTGEYLRPMINITAMDVPVAYRPSDALIADIRKPAPLLSVAARDGNKPDGVLPRLIQEATELRMEKGAFISECNRICKRMNIDTEAAAVIVLKEKGADITPFVADVRSSVLGR
ncbi:MAG: DUF2240 family protein [Candidatus Methanoplasma sp.]|nr:DUF2240 family protein [Candidatus Methanoplasma sp.]